jgi:hypothetical protein
MIEKNIKDMYSEHGHKPKKNTNVIPSPQNKTESAIV